MPTEEPEKGAIRRVFGEIIKEENYEISLNNGQHKIFFTICSCEKGQVVVQLGKICECPGIDDWDTESDHDFACTMEMLRILFREGISYVCFGTTIMRILIKGQALNLQIIKSIPDTD